MAALTTEQREEIADIVNERMKGLSTLSKDQRGEIDALIDAKAKATGLSPGQKWEVGVTVAVLLGGALSIFGTAGWFAITSTATSVAQNKVVEVQPGVVADRLYANKEFVHTVAGMVSTLPVGGVVAFDLSEGCPRGWSTFASATGRAIIGAGTVYAEGSRSDEAGRPLTPRPFRALGGEEAHVLTIDELPAHAHDAYRAVGDGDGLYPKAAVMGPRAQPIPASTQPTGANKPHNNMQPFIALTICRRD